MAGFFSAKEVQSVTRPQGKLMSCAACGLSSSPYPQIESTGEFGKKILIVTDVIEPEDAKNGKPFQGRAGRFFEKELRAVGIDLWKDCLSTQLVRCVPVDENQVIRPPTSKETGSCYRKIQKLIRQKAPYLVILVGNLTTTALIAPRWVKGVGSIEKWRGWAIPDQYHQTYFCPVYSPVEILERQERNPEYQTVWKADLTQIGELIKKQAPFPQLPPLGNLVKILTPSEALNVLEELLSRKYPFMAAIDYETTGLKPHNTDAHRIVCASICTEPDLSYAFSLNSNRVRNPWRKLLESPIIGKVAHNMKFEHSWSKNILKTDVGNWTWDTMLATHLLDNRPDITGLKFQTYVNFGVSGYDDEISRYLRSDDTKNSNSVNNIMKAVNNSVLREKLFTYCALDSLFTYKLARKQMEVVR